MAATFTAAQWKELERQAMIYKYMVASVPVPYELLLPIIQNLPPSNSPCSVVTQLRYSAKQDLEPGRCKRTDGKKWRCSRDVAPNQKYCERHMHRGRPRSRKHVEPILNNKNRRPKLVGSEAPLFVDNMHTQTLDNRALDSGSEQQRWSILKNDFGEEQTSCFTDFIEAYKSSVSASGVEVSIAAGGPLAEVLGAGAYPTGDGDSRVSSPSGVLQRTMLSLSDGSSVCSSPATPTAFQWFT